jgi:hypothetical protein
MAKYLLSDYILTEWGKNPQGFYSPNALKNARKKYFNNEKKLFKTEILGKLAQ